MIIFRLIALHLNRWLSGLRGPVVPGAFVSASNHRHAISRYHGEHWPPLDGSLDRPV